MKNGTIIICMGANIDMLAALIEDVTERVNTAQIDISSGRQDAAIGGLSGLDQIFDQAKALYLTSLMAHTTQLRTK